MGSAEMFEVSTRMVQDVTVVEIVGDLDGNTAPRAQAEILPIAQPEGRMILDMTRVPYMSSAGLRMLLSLYRTIRQGTGSVALVGLSEEIRDTMSMTGFLDFFIVYESVDQGLEALAPGGEPR